MAHYPLTWDLEDGSMALLYWTMKNDNGKMDYGLVLPSEGSDFSITI